MKDSMFKRVETLNTGSQGERTLKPLKFTVSINPEALPEITDGDFVLKYVDIGNVDSFGGVQPPQEMNFDDAPSRARRIVRAKDTIISTVRTYLKAVAYFDSTESNLIASTGFAVLRPRLNLVHPKFLYYFVSSESFVQAISAFSVGVSYPAINSSDLGSLDVSFPSLDEQHRIADFLDRKTAQTDDLIAKKERQIELLQEKLQTLVGHTVTKGLNRAVVMKDSRIDWIGKIPEHWHVSPVRTRYVVQLGKMLDQKRVSGEALAPYLRNADVLWDRVNVEDLPQMDFDDDDKKRFVLKTGDLLVCEGGEVGRAALWNAEISECYYQKALHRLRPIDPKKDCPRFFYYVLRFAAKYGVFIANGNPNTFDHLTAEKLKQHRYPCPPISEQVMICEFLDRENCFVQQVTEKIAEQIHLLREYRMTIISNTVTGKFRVEND